MRNTIVQAGNLLLLLSILLLSAPNARTQTPGPEPLKYAGTLTFLDGTPVNFGYSESDDLKVTNTLFPKLYAAYGKMEKDSLFITCIRAGEHIVSFMGQEVARFDVEEVDGRLQTSLSRHLSLPFNYLVEGQAGDKVLIYAQDLSLLQSLTLDESGVAAITFSAADFRDKFMASQKEEQFIEPFIFQQVKPQDAGNLNKRLFRMGTRKLEAGRAMVHNLTDDAYYAVQRVFFSDVQNANSRFLLKKYDARNKQAALYPINFDPGDQRGTPALALDYQGNLILLFTDQRYRLSNTGKLSEADDIYVSPIYQFHDYFVKGGRWIVPVFAGIPMPKGAHTFTVTCQGKESNASSTETFNVVFDPSLEYLYRMESPLDKKDLKDGYYFPTGVDPESDLSDITIRECHISVDGQANLLYSYLDETLLKGIQFTDWDSDAHRQKAIESAKENARRYIGFNPEGNAWKRDLALFSPDQRMAGSEPLNMYEGPYPELRYMTWVVTGEYPDRKAAEAHCRQPFRASSGKYQCREQVVVKICPDNFRTKEVNGARMTDYEALQCGTADPLDNVASGDEIVVEFSKEGYVTKTRALSKRTLEASSILLSGHIRDERGVELEGAHVKLRNIDGAAVTDEAGIYHLTAKAQGEKSHSEVMDIQLQKIGIEISHEELGVYEGKPWGIVSDGFTTLELKVKANGIRPNTVSVKQPELGQFVERTMLKVPLVLNGSGEGVLEYVPPEYLTADQLNVQLPLTDTSQAKHGMGYSLWAAEVPVVVTYEDEAGNPGSMSFKIYVTRPPVFLIHGFTGNETTWADLGAYLRARKFNALIHEYYEGPVDESTIPRQSQKLGQYIQDVRACYQNNGIYQTRIDIVAHSMGGLISRHYISNMARYGEKSGIVIPYNVKLSRDELAAQRFQQPVILNDVRKLVMVGTPNHGSSFIDGLIGHLSAILDDNHQLANAQLRSNSPFIIELNQGESEGRHLSPHVQYALLYGIRRVSPLYPPDFVANSQTEAYNLVMRPLAFDDGVVTIHSARLNGVTDFHFPQDREVYSMPVKYKYTAPNGFIHSPAVGSIFRGDKSITTDEEIFAKAAELLLTDIPRAPLQNSYARIIQSEGDAALRYFSHHDWQPVAPGAHTKLENPWCYFKTEEGTLSIGFYLNGHHWASMHLQPHTIVQLEHASPELVQVYLQEGKARFRSRKQGGGGFEIVMGDTPEQWYSFNPHSRVSDVSTDFIIEEGAETVVQSISGQVIVGIPPEKDGTGKAVTLGTAQGRKILNGKMQDAPLPAQGWWSGIDTTYLPDEAAEPVGETPDTARINLVVNGSFEAGPDFTRYIVLNTGDSIPGWTVTAGSVDIVDQSFQPSEGGRALDLLGTGKVGSIRQIIPTAPGQYYLVQFDLAGNPLGAPDKKLMEIGAGDQSLSFTFSIEGKTPQNMGWEPQRLVFAADSDSTAIVFTGNDPEGPGGAGAIIDHVRVFAISEEEAMRIMEEDQPIQKLGEVATAVSGPALPVGSFTQLSIQATNEAGDPLISPYEVQVDLENAEQLAFIHINSANQVIDAQGQYTAHITIGEPDPEQYASLSAIPLEATFRVQLLHPRSKVVEYEQKITLPLGMTLLRGQTLGPDYQPRQEPVPPEFYETQYQIANQNDARGNFYILFNTTLFEADIERFRQHAERTQKLFSMDQFDFYLEWSANCSAPLRYALPDSILHQLKAGQQVSVGKNGYIDLLTPQEQETRIKSLVSRFVEQMPLETEKRSRLITQLEQLAFVYTSSVRYPTFDERLVQANTLLAPIAETYWNSEFLDDPTQPAFQALMHAMGHYLQWALIGTDQPFYGFLSGHCNGGQTLWSHQHDPAATLFDPALYISFHEAAADFFAYLMTRFLETQDDPIVRKSVYFHPGYLLQFGSPEKALEIGQKFPAYAVSGIQTAFLTDYYDTQCSDDPALVYADFLLTQWVYGRLAKNGAPAATINEWLHAKRSATSEECLVNGPAPLELALQFGLPEPERARLIPAGNRTDAQVDLNGVAVRNLEQVPAIFLEPDARVKTANTRFQLILSTDDELKLLFLEPDADFQLGPDLKPQLNLGAFTGFSPLEFGTPLAQCSAASTTYRVLLDGEDTLLEVWNGHLTLQTDKEEETVNAGEGTTINKRGKAKKPKELKGVSAPATPKAIKHPFLLHREPDKLNP